MLVFVDALIALCLGRNSLLLDLKRAPLEVSVQAVDPLER